MNTSTNAGGVDANLGENSGQEKEAVTVETKSKESVAFETYDKTMAELKKAKAKLAEIEAQKKSDRDKDLAAKENFKLMVEERDKELLETKQKLTNYEQNYQNAQKLNAVLASLNGEVDEQYWGLIDLSKIAVDPETGSPDKTSAAKYAKEFSSKFSLVVKKPTGVKIPADAANGSGTGVPSYEEWTKMPLQEMKKHQAAVMANYKKA